MAKMIKRFLDQNIGIFVGTALMASGILIVNGATNGSLVRLMGGITNQDLDLFLDSAKLKTRIDEISSEISLPPSPDLSRYVLKQEFQDSSRYLFGGIFTKEDDDVQSVANPLAGMEHKCPAGFQEIDSKQSDNISN